MLQLLSSFLPNTSVFMLCVVITLLLKAGATAHTAVGHQDHARGLDQAEGKTSGTDPQ